MKNIKRPRNGHEALDYLKKGFKIEIVDTHAFKAAEALSGHLSYSFKLSKWNKGWAGFEKC